MKDREQMEKDRDNKWKLEEIKLQLEMEIIRTEQLRIDADTRTKAIEAEKELKFAERRMDSGDIETRSSGYLANVRLPKLDLMKFDGDIFKWQEFWDSFNTAIHRKELNKVDKYNYLKSQLQHDAKEVISGLEMTDAN